MLAEAERKAFPDAARTRDRIGVAGYAEGRNVPGDIEDTEGERGPGNGKPPPADAHLRQAAIRGRIRCGLTRATLHAFGGDCARGRHDG